MFKNFKVLFAILLLAGDFSCSKSNTPAAAIALDGSWQIIETVTSNCKVAADNNIKVPYYGGNIYSFNAGQWTLKSNNGTVLYTGKYSLSGSNITLFSAAGTTSTTFSYTFSGNNLILSSYDSGIHCTISSIYSKK